MRNFIRGIIRQQWDKPPIRVRGGVDAVAASTDPYWSNVVLLVGNDSAADGTTTFTDQSVAAHAMTGTGNAQWDTAQAPTGLTSTILFGGTGDSVTTADSADFNFGTGDFTIEVFGRAAVLGSTQIACLVSQIVNDAQGNKFWTLRIENNTNWGQQFRVFSNAGSEILNLSEGTDFTDTTAFHYFAVNRSGNDFTLARDGVSKATTTASITMPDLAGPLYIGSVDDGTFGQFWNGWGGSIRITKGVARDILSIPSLPFPTS